MDYEQAQHTLTEIQQLTSDPGFRNFVAQAHSRSVLQRLSVASAQWPSYTLILDENLLYTAHLLFWQGIQIRDVPDFRVDGDELIKQGAEILEFLYSETNGSEVNEQIDELFNAALGYYIAGHYARAYVLMKDLEIEGDLPQEFELLHRLFLKNLGGLRGLIYQVLGDNSYSDATIARALRNGEITQDEALDRILRASFNRAFSYFIEYPKTGRHPLLERAREILDEGIELTEKLKFVHWWWLFFVPGISLMSSIPTPFGHN